MRVLVCNPGASYSTFDIFEGYRDALVKLGHEVKIYSLDGRIDRAAQWLNWNWRKAGRPDPKPNAADILYWAGVPLVEMALRLQPDVVLVISGMYLLPDIAIMLRRAGVKVAVLLSESPYDLDREANFIQYVDLAWTNERASVPVLRAKHPNVGYMPHAYNPARHFPVADDTPSLDVCFIGTMFQERVDLLSAIDWTGINLGLYGSFGLLGSRSKLRQYIRGGITPNEASVEIYRRSRICLNLYRQSMGFGKDAPRITGAESLNSRAYELAACGAFQISDARAEVAEVFGTSVPTFETPEGLEALIRQYLAADSERRALAERARQLVQPHTYDARAEQLTEVLSGARRAA